MDNQDRKIRIIEIFRLGSLLAACSIVPPQAYFEGGLLVAVVTTAIVIPLTLWMAYVDYVVWSIRYPYVKASILVLFFGMLNYSFESYYSGVLEKEFSKLVTMVYFILIMCFFAFSIERYTVNKSSKKDAQKPRASS